MRRMAQSTRVFAREALIGLYRARAMNLLTVGIIAASLSILGGFLILVENFRPLVADWNRVQIYAYLRDAAVEESAPAVQDLIARLTADPHVASVRFVSREAAMRLFTARHAELAQSAGSLGSNPFPASLEIAVRETRGQRLHETGRVHEMLTASSLVETIQDNQREARRLLTGLRIASAVVLATGGVLALASLFIIFNVIRLTVYARRDEIAIMRLVGATSRFIRGPFLVEGMMQGLLGALAALAVLYAGHVALADYAGRSGNTLAGMMTGRFLPVAGSLMLCAGGLAIGLAGSALSVRRFLID